MKRMVIFVMGLVLILGMNLDSMNKRDRGDAIAAAEAWLKWVDNGNFGQSWEKAAPFFKQSLKKGDWEKLLKKIMVPLGPALKRELIGAKYYSSIPNAPKGEYIVIQFRSDFKNKKNAVETITPMKVGGKWLVCGYYIR